MSTKIHIPTILFKLPSIYCYFLAIAEFPPHHATTKPIIEEPGLYRVVLRGLGRLSEIVDDQCVDPGVALAKPSLRGQPIEIRSIARQDLNRLALVFERNLS